VERFADELDLAQFRIDQVTELAIAAIRNHSSLAVGREFCRDCGDVIPAKRLRCVPNATRCAPCQELQELQEGRGTRRSRN
jgi:phage/conjugal plasmid C-4 type zinc finger TraR family protein